MKHTQKGFTLVELLVVIAILAILATVSVVGYTAYIDKANNSVAMQEAQPYESMIKYEISFNGYCKVGVSGSNTYYAVNASDLSSDVPDGIVIVNSIEKNSEGKYTASAVSTNVALTNNKLDATIMGSDTPAGTFTITDGKIVYTSTKNGGTYTFFAN